MAKKKKATPVDTGTDIGNLGMSIYGYTQGKKGYNDLIERYRDAIAGNTKATNDAKGLLNSAYDKSSVYSKDKYKNLMGLLDEAQGAIAQQDKNLYSKSNQINERNIDSQNNQLLKNIGIQNDLTNTSFDKTKSILKNNYKALKSNANSELGREDYLYRNELANQKAISQQGYDASRKDLSGQYQPAIDAYNPYTQGGANAQGLLDRKSVV